MKFVLLSIIALTLTTSAFAAPKKSAYQRLKSDAQEFIQVFESQTEECDYRVKETRDGITISVKKDKAPVVYIDVASDAKITMKGDESSDGSFGHTYTIKGEGKVEFVHVDDAYDHLYVTKDGETTSCELDY